MMTKFDAFSVELEPAILGNIFDGIQRPLKTIAKRSGDVYIPRGISVPVLDKQPKKIGTCCSLMVCRLILFSILYLALFTQSIPIFFLLHQFCYFMVGFYSTSVY